MPRQLKPLQGLVEGMGFFRAHNHPQCVRFIKRMLRGGWHYLVGSDHPVAERKNLLEQFWNPDGRCETGPEPDPCDLFHQPSPSNRTPVLTISRQASRRMAPLSLRPSAPGGPKIFSTDCSQRWR